jgi:2-oxoglutarate dehydrogenase complex dehydrogenase (E1) component-like enzyme
MFYENIQEANFSFAYPTKPANFFHLLRRQMKRNFRKPLVIAGPKTLLRHPKCLSKFEDMSETTHFKRILHYTKEETVKSCKNLLLCSGKYVYDI